PSRRRSRIIGGSLLGPCSRILLAPPYRLAPRPCGERCRVHSGLQTSKPPVPFRILCPLISGLFARKLPQKQCEYAAYTLHTNFRAAAVQPQTLHFSIGEGTGTGPEGPVDGHEDRADVLSVLGIGARHSRRCDAPVGAQRPAYTGRHLRSDLRI